MSENENIVNHLQEAERIGEQAAEFYDKGFIEKLSKADSKIVKAFNTRYQAINYQHEFGLITTEEYYKKLERARDMYFSRDTQEWHKYTKEIYDYQKSAMDDYIKDVEENLSELIKATANSKEKLIDYAGGTKGFDSHKVTVENYWPNGDAVTYIDHTLTDYKEEIEKLKSFNDSITKLKEKASGLDPEILSVFFGDMRDMSVEDAKILADLLLQASDEDFNEYFKLYDERNTLAENMATVYNSDGYVELAQGIKEELGSVFESLPEDFFEYGHLIGEGFSDAFKSEIEGLFTDFTFEIPVIESGGDSNVENTTFSPVYYFFGDRATTSRTRFYAKNDALYSYMQGTK